MTTTECCRTRTLLACCGLLCLAACNDTPPQSAPSAEDTTKEARAPKADAPRTDSGHASTRLPIVSLDSGTTESSDGAPGKAPQSGPQWLLGEIEEIRAEPFPETADASRIRSIRRLRNEKIIDLAMDLVAQTYDRPERQEFFTEGVRYLMEARLQLALQGDRNHIDALYEHANSLYQQAPDSQAAAEAAFAVARFAHTNARRYADHEPRWLQEFARQATTFARNFPDERQRVLPLLAAAARSCELHEMRDTAETCYRLLWRNYPQTPQGRQAAACLRRLQLPGKPLQFTGPTINGGSVSIDDYRGKVVLIVFWSTQTKRFREALPELKALAKQAADSGLQFVGVNLDEEESTLKAFLKKHAMTWPQVFFPEPEKRGWDHPLVQRFGIQDIPTYWLVDRQGVVVETSVQPDALRQRVESVLNARQSQDE